MNTLQELEKVIESAKQEFGELGKEFIGYSFISSEFRDIYNFDEMVEIANYLLYNNSKIIEITEYDIFRIKESLNLGLGGCSIKNQINNKDFVIILNYKIINKGWRNELLNFIKDH